MERNTCQQMARIVKELKEKPMSDYVNLITGCLTVSPSELTITKPYSIVCV
jgi:hypothetical protein